MPNVSIGVDIASYQGYANFEVLKDADVGFVIIKATEGVGYTNPFFAHNWAQASIDGMPRGLYHYCHPSENAPADEVTHLQRVLDANGGLKQGDILALDVEDPKAVGDISQWVAEWLALAEDVFKVRPWFYSGRHYMSAHSLLNPAFGAYPLWLAAYSPTMPPPPTGWERITCWQYSETGNVRGVVGNVDLNEFQGSIGDFRALGFQASSVLPAESASPAGLTPATPPDPTPEFDGLWDISEKMARTARGRGRAVAIQRHVVALKRKWGDRPE